MRRLVLQGRLELDQSAKAELLALLTQAVRTGDEIGPLMVAIHRYVASLVDVLDGLGKRLVIPVYAGEVEPARGE